MNNDFAKEKMSEDVFLRVENVTVGYRGLPILPAISFALRSKQVTSIVGHNGSGKSTLLKTLLGLTPILSGKIEFAPGSHIGYVPQREAMDPIYPVTVLELVKTGRFGIRGLGRALNSTDIHKVESAMQSTRVELLAKRLFRTLSGGEQQRVLLARALCTEPNLLILDEPTASMDEKGARETMDMTLDLARRQGAAILMVNHFIDLVAQVSDQVILLDRDHQIAKVGSPTELLAGRGGLSV
ncbi:MAG: metal ABC transporter ATP-binding protein [Chitinophagaceae bacterium]|nr:metal ABC transporter ATP-binding protein [Oligoflexus sp.]